MPIETEERLIARTFEVTAASAAFLMAAGLTTGPVHIQDNPLQSFAFVDSVHPSGRQVHQGLPIPSLSQYLCLKSPHDAGGGRRPFHGSATGNMSYGGVKSQRCGVIRVVIAGKRAED